MPAFVPWPEAVVRWTGVADLLGALALAQPWCAGLRRASGAGLALYALCVWPANMNHFAMDMARPDHGWGLGYHIVRMLAQPVLIWLGCGAAASPTGRDGARPDQSSSLPATP